MDYTITWGGDPEDVCLAARGVARPEDLDAMTRAAVGDPRWVDGMRVLIDYTEADLSGLMSREIEERASAVKAMAAQIGRQHLAWVMPDVASYEVGRLFSRALDWQVGFVGRAFMSVHEAREWLRAPVASELPHVEPRP